MTFPLKVGAMVILVGIFAGPLCMLALALDPTWIDLPGGFRLPRTLEWTQIVLMLGILWRIGRWGREIAKNVEAIPELVDKTIPAMQKAQEAIQLALQKEQARLDLIAAQLREDSDRRHTENVRRIETIERDMEKIQQLVEAENEASRLHRLRGVRQHEVLKEAVRVLKERAKGDEE